MGSIANIGWLLAFCGVSLLSCERAPLVPAPQDYAYFPLETGRFVEYDVVETIYTLSTPPSTQTYQLREYTAQSFVDLSGQESYRIERFRRTNASQAWAPDSVWVAKRTLNQAIRTENNLSYLKLVFPLSQGLRWNGNAFNTLGGQEAGQDEYILEDLNQPKQIGKETFDKTLTIRQQNDSTLVNLDRRTEIYALNVGLVYKEISQLAYCYQGTCLGKGQVDFGVRRIQKVSRYGKE